MKLENKINKLYNLSIIKNTISWQAAINPNHDLYKAEEICNNDYDKYVMKFMTQEKNHPISKQLSKSFIDPKLALKQLKIKHKLWNKYLELRKTKSNADNEYYHLLYDMVSIVKYISKQYNRPAYYSNDGSLGDFKKIFNIVEKMAYISKNKIDQLSKNKIDQLSKEERYNIFSQRVFNKEEVKKYSKSFDNIECTFSNKNGSFMTHINKNLAFIHIKENDEVGNHEFLSSVSHEIGHALYQIEVLNNTLCTGIFGDFISLSLHESSSILNEISCSGLIYNITDYKKMYRLGSHKLYYIIHLYIRMKIEKEILYNDRFTVFGIPILWNELCLEFFGQEPENDFEGFLQDVHWNMGLFGYFQSYGIGFFNAINMFLDIEQQLTDNLKNNTEIVLDKIKNTFGKFNNESKNILNQLYPDINTALSNYENFVNKRFY